MLDPLTIIVDADALIAIANPNDVHTAKTMATLKKLSVQAANLLVPTTAIAEVITTLQRKLNSPLLTKNIVKLSQNESIVIKSVGEDILSDAYTLFNPTKSKHNTLFDAIIAASANYYKADAILSYDHWYREIGLKLVQDLI